MMLIQFAQTVVLLYIWYLVASSKAVFPILSGSHQIHLSISPTKLSAPHIIFVVCFIVIKPVLRSLRLVPSIDTFATTSTRQNAQARKLQITSTLTVNSSDIAKYHSIVAPESGDLGRPSIFALVPLTEPVALLMLARRINPILPLGCVNTKNRFEFLQPDMCRVAQFDDQYNLLCELGSVMRNVKRGVECDIITEVWHTSNKSANEPIMIMRKVATFLQIQKRTGPSDGANKTTTLDEESPKKDLQFSENVQLESTLPRRWASICKDYNVLHISNLAAKMFGFKGIIAHGNAAAAKAIEALARTENTAFSQMWCTSSRPSWLEVEFKRPMVVPMKVEVKTNLAYVQDREPACFELENNLKTYVAGKAGWFS